MNNHFDAKVAEGEARQIVPVSGVEDVLFLSNIHGDACR